MLNTPMMKTGEGKISVDEILFTMIDLDLWRNTIKYRNRHKHKDAVETILHFIIVK